MSTHAGEITLRDLLAWMPDLEIGSLPAPGGPGDDPLDRDVEWVVSARERVPMLPTLRGAELILLPRRIVFDSAVPLALLVNEIAVQPVAGVVIDIDPPAASRVPVLTVPAITPELESDLNRLLMSRRNDLLRTGAEIERSISELTSLGAGPGELIEQLSELLEFGIVITNSSGAVAYTSLGDAHGSPGTAGSAESWIQQPLRRGHTLWIGPITTNRSALARLIGKRLRDAVQQAMDHAEATAPHGAARVHALNQILVPPAGMDPDRLATAAVRAGLPLGATYRVALHPATTDPALRRRLSTLGQDFEAGTVAGFAAHILVSDTDRQIVPSRRPFESERDDLWLVISEPVPTARQLPSATRQARYLAALRANQQLDGVEIYFDRDHQIGPYRLLYEHWGTERIPKYVDSLIGDLIREDRRGLLRATLRAYLEHGGAQRLTAERLAIHRNTLTYRLRQIRSVLHADPDDPDVRLGLHLALLAAELPQPDGLA